MHRAECLVGMQQRGSKMDRNTLNSIACAEYNQVSRRQLMTSGVKVGVLSALGIGLTDYFQMAQAMPKGVDSGKATGCSKRNPWRL
jgi:hypothetical protein